MIIICFFLNETISQEGAKDMVTYPRIRELREAHGLTQRQLADMLGMHQPQYFRYEQGSRDLPTELLIRLSGIYSVSVDYLLGLTDNPKRTG